MKKTIKKLIKGRSRILNIKSEFCNEKKEEILIAAGSAITLKSNAEDEYNECLLKANAMLKVLGLDVTSLNVIK